MINFLIAHWELSLAFIFVALYWITTELALLARGSGIAAPHLVQLMNRDQAVVIDLRSLEDFRQQHILQAISMPQAQLAKELAKLKKYQAKTLVLVDEQGIQASKCLKILTKAGFINPHYLKGGLQGWKQASLPLQRG